MGYVATLRLHIETTETVDAEGLLETLSAVLAYSTAKDAIADGLDDSGAFAGYVEGVEFSIVALEAEFSIVALEAE